VKLENCAKLLKTLHGEVPEWFNGSVLLNLPALFALADFHVFSVIYAALSCAAMSIFAGYSAPRVHQEFVIAIRPRTGFDRITSVYAKSGT